MPLADQLLQSVGRLGQGTHGSGAWWAAPTGDYSLARRCIRLAARLAEFCRVVQPPGGLDQAQHAGVALEARAPAAVPEAQRAAWLQERVGSPPLLQALAGLGLPAYMAAKAVWLLRPLAYKPPGHPTVNASDYPTFCVEWQPAILESPCTQLTPHARDQGYLRLRLGYTSCAVRTLPAAGGPGGGGAAAAANAGPPQQPAAAGGAAGGGAQAVAQGGAEAGGGQDVVVVAADDAAAAAAAIVVAAAAAGAGGASPALAAAAAAAVGAGEPEPEDASNNDEAAEPPPPPLTLAMQCALAVDDAVREHLWTEEEAAQRGAAGGAQLQHASPSVRYLVTGIATALTVAAEGLPQQARHVGEALQGAHVRQYGCGRVQPMPPMALPTQQHAQSAGRHMAQVCLGLPQHMRTRREVSLTLPQLVKELQRSLEAIRRHDNDVPGWVIPTAEAVVAGLREGLQAGGSGSPAQQQLQQQQPPLPPPLQQQQQQQQPQQEVLLLLLPPAQEQAQEAPAQAQAQTPAAAPGLPQAPAPPLPPPPTRCRRRRKHSQPVYELAHRLLAWMVYGPSPNPHAKKVVGHLCGNKRCLNVLHLAWMSQRTNTAYHNARGKREAQERAGQAYQEAWDTVLRRAGGLWPSNDHGGVLLDGPA